MTGLAPTVSLRSAQCVPKQDALVKFIAKPAKGPTRSVVIGTVGKRPVTVQAWRNRSGGV
jgi:hypothetical protein